MGVSGLNLNSAQYGPDHRRRPGRGAARTVELTRVQIQAAGIAVQHPMRVTAAYRQPLRDVGNAPGRSRQVALRGT